MSVKCTVHINYRYEVAYKENKTEKWKDIKCKTLKEAKEYYDMIGEEASFKVLYDLVSGDQIENS